MAYNHLSAPNAELQPLLDVLPPRPKPSPGGVLLERAGFKALLKELLHDALRDHLPAESAYVIKDHKVPVEGAEILVRSYTPTSASDSATYPLLFWVHGGGWCIGDIDMDDYYLRILCVDLQVTIVQVEYRLAPEHPFPGSLNDSYAALRWAAENAAKFKAVLSKGFVVAGQSAGAEIVAELAHRGKVDPAFKKHPLTGQALQIPSTVHPDGVPNEYKDRYTAFEQNAEKGILLTSDWMRIYYDRLQGAPTNPEAWPLLQPSFEGLPATYIQVCGLDPLRDDGLLYAEKLKAAGIPTKLDVYPGTPHGFSIRFPKTALAQKFDAEFRAGLRWLFSGVPAKL
ncbi:Alpha/Beta hydrolase protein [Lenzites betulinus]|nr:Alpha/Beta hydrolase protein [Lenzites betulinus]